MSMLRMNRVRMSKLDREIVASLRLTFEAETALSAAKVDELKEKYPEIAEAIQSLNGSLEQKRLQKYFVWGVKQLNDAQAVEKVLNALDEFEVLLRKKRAKPGTTAESREVEPFLKGQERDINFYKTLQQLVERIESAKQEVEERDVEEASKAEALKKIKEKGVVYIYHGPDFLVARPITKKASCHYGLGTKWCISDPEMDYFNKYSREDNRYFYFVIDRSKDASGKAIPDPNNPDAKVNDPWAKVCFVFQKGDHEVLEAWNVPDIKIPIGKVLAHYTKQYGHKKIFELLGLMYKDMESLPDTWQYAASKGKDPSRLLEVYEQVKEEDEDALEVLAKNPNLPVELQEKLAKSSSLPVLTALLENESLPSSVALDLAKNPDPKLREMVAARIKDNKDALVALANDEEVSVRTAVAERLGSYYKTTPVEVLAELLKDKNVTAEIAELVGRGAPARLNAEQVLKVLKLSPDTASAFYRNMYSNEVIRSPEVAEALLDTGKLSDYENREILKLAPLTVDRLERLLADPNMHGVVLDNELATAEMIAKIAEVNPGFSEAGIADAVDTSLQEKAAEHKNTPPELLSRLAKSKSANVLREVASNEATPVETLRDLTLLGNSQVTGWGFSYMLKALASNKNTPMDAIEDMLARHKGVFANVREIQEGLLKNPNVTPEQLRQMATDHMAAGAVAGHPKTPVDVLEELARTQMYRASGGLAKNPNATPDILMQVFKHYDSEWGGVRRNGDKMEVAMRNPNFPMDILVELAKKPGTKLGKAAREIMKDRADAPAPAKRGRKPKAPAMNPTDVQAHVQELAEVVHMLNLPVSVRLAMEEAADLLSE